METSAGHKFVKAKAIISSFLLVLRANVLKSLTMLRISIGLYPQQVDVDVDGDRYLCVCVYVYVCVHTYIHSYSATNKLFIFVSLNPELGSRERPWLCRCWSNESA